jgi:hypothetical protein
MPRLSTDYCMRFMGQKVVAHHVNGCIYEGILYSVSKKGIYLMNTNVIQQASASTNELSVQHAITDSDKVDISEAFFPFLFLPLVALAGLAASRPYPYGYYPGPWYY